MDNSTDIISMLRYLEHLRLLIDHMQCEQPYRLNVIDELHCNVYNEQDIESVQLETSVFKNYEKANYVKILNKYYFIRKKFREHNIIRFQLEEDVLFSILNKNLSSVSIIADRQENIYNNYINDDEMKGLAYTQVATIPFSTSLNQDTVILMTVG